MAETLEFNDMYQEVKGSMNDSQLRLSHQGINFKNSKTGKVDNIPARELTEGIWHRVALGHGLKLLTKNGHVYKYDGFQELAFEKLSDFFKTHYRLELMENDLCVKGWNLGTVKFGGQLLSFDIGDQQVFEIPLSNVSQYITGKNEVTLKFHQNDDAEVSLMEVCFHMLPTQEDGHYDIRIYPISLHLHGKTFDYKIPYTMVLWLFLLPHKDQRQMFFVISLDPRIKQSQTHYHFLILLFSKDEDISLTLNVNEEEVERRFKGRLTKNMSGSLYEMVSQIMKVLVNHKITCISCSYKASSGLLYPLEWGFIYIHKLPVHICFYEISFREENGKLFDFVNAKKLIKNRGLKEDQHDAYLERMKEEGKIQEENSFNPGEEEEDVAEEFDSNASACSSNNEGDSDREEKKEAAQKDPNTPKRPMSAYILWLNASREKIKSDHLGISITDLSTKAEEWDRKAEDARREYEKAMKEHEGVKVKMEKKSTPSRGLSLKSSSRQLSENFKSKEFVSKDSEEEELASSLPSSEDSVSGSDE
ncbi:hypothetical protein FD755_024830 [Muntiacus reevesi]|uniref:FACT complex subunit SSRP1 n=1 Tax=Muntiacus reevesi TaxID=9886 RepID=A0A5N3UTB4_MUNRE|nr:hypothetical protein FD755_024830 [Muntiacus reevesi]